jgi:hypothetical protein
MSELYTLIGFQTELDPSLILSLSITPFGTQSMKLKDGSELNQTSLFSQIQMILTYVLSL